MKVPFYETSPGALAALLATGVFVRCDLHTFNLSGGAGTIRIAAADLDVTYPGGPVWSSLGPRVDPKGSSQTGHWKRGLDVDTWQTVIMPRIVDPFTGALFPDKINGSPWTAAARQGALDGADYQVDRAYFAAWPQPFVPVFKPVGIITIFAGLSSSVVVNDTTVTISSDDYRTLLSAQMPRNVFQSGCPHTLYDAGCKLLESNFSVASAVVGSVTRSKIGTPIVSAPGSGTFALGRIIMTSGLNIGYSRTISAWDGSFFYLLNPMPFDVALGDTFVASSGCDKQQTTCIAFGNKPNYGGEDYIPSPEAAI